MWSVALYFDFETNLHDLRGWNSEISRREVGVEGEKAKGAVDGRFGGRFEALSRARDMDLLREPAGNAIEADFVAFYGSGCGSCLGG